MPTANALTLTGNVASTDAQQTSDVAFEEISSTAVYYSEKILAGSAYFTGVYAKMARFGSPSGTFKIGIQSDSAGKPDGVYLGSMEIQLDTMSSTAQWTGGEFTSAIPATSGNPYHIVLTPSASATLSSSSALRWYRDNNNSYANGYIESSVNNGSTWTSSTSFDFAFKAMKQTQVVLSYPRVASVLPVTRKIYEDVRLKDGSIKRYQVGVKKEWNVEVHFNEGSDDVNNADIVNLEALLEYDGTIQVDDYIWENKSYTALINDGSGRMAETEILKKVIYQLNMVEV